ncbi:MAG: hypothetical protein IJV71_12155 [Lachnospiraceae bacterium]|nr:hypothetical protein [Lachnospiraceae bacterium]
MAIYDATPVKCEVNKITKINLEAATTAKDGIRFVLPSADESLVIVVQNTSSDSKSTITLKAPTNGSYAATTSDESLELEAGESALIRIESAKYANNDGTVVLVPSALTVKAAVLY